MIPVLGKPFINYKNYLPSGVQVIMHRVGWHGTSNHLIPITNYISADPRTCDSEIALMDSYGVDIVEQLWHGPSSPFHRSVLEMAAATERASKGFKLNLGSKVGPDTQSFIDALVYAARTFFNAPNYMMIGGKPVVSFFGAPAAVDFTAVRTALGSANPLFIFEGFTHPEADGAFGWPRPQLNPDDFGLTRLLQFRDQAHAAPTKIAFYPIFKGFYDPNPKDSTKSVWPVLVNGVLTLVPVRRMNANDGLTLLETLKLVPADAQYVLGATLDDAEEGTWMLQSQGEL